MPTGETKDAMDTLISQYRTSRTRLEKLLIVPPDKRGQLADVRSGIRHFLRRIRPSGEAVEARSPTRARRVFDFTNASPSRQA